jgi:hypothetical protein
MFGCQSILYRADHLIDSVLGVLNLWHALSHGRPAYLHEKTTTAWHPVFRASGGVKSG